MPNATITTTCCIAGGGPAGMMLGFLLARAGVNVVVLEKHADFFRDFRGDTIHPSTLELMHELGLLDEFLKLPHQKVERLTAQIGDERVRMIDLTHLPTHCKYIALMPQWDFLNFLAAQGRALPGLRSAHAHGSDRPDRGRRPCRRASRQERRTANSTIRADLVVGADGRHSTVRDKAGLKSDDYGAPMDVLWFRVCAQRPTDESRNVRPHRGRQDDGHARPRRLLAMRLRHSERRHRPGQGEPVSTRSAARVVELSPFLADRVGELKSWDDVKLLSVTVDRLRQMVAAGADLHRRCRARDVADRRRRHQPRRPGCGRRRQPSRRAAQGGHGKRRGSCARSRSGARSPVRFTQWLQLTMQNQIISRVLASTQRPKPPLLFKLFDMFPVLRRIPARLLAVGIRPEHVHTPDVLSAS